MFLRATRLLLGVSVFVLLFSACSLFKKEPPHAFNWKVPDFTYKDENNQSFGLKDLKGKVWIADFVFTHCTSVCPVETSQMALLQKKLKQAKVPVQLISFSVDPERDTPEVLKRYAGTYQADLANWHFLTGYHFDEIKQLSEGTFKSALAAPESGSDQYTHGTSFFIVNKDGVIVQRYDGYDGTPFDQIVSDASALQ